MKLLTILTIVILLTSCSKKTTDEVALTGSTFNKVINSFKDPDSVIIKEKKIVAKRKVVIPNGEKRDFILTHFRVKAKNSFGAYIESGVCAHIILNPDDLSVYYGQIGIYECNRDAPTIEKIASIEAVNQWQKYKLRKE